MSGGIVSSLSQCHPLIRDSSEVLSFSDSPGVLSIDPDIRPLFPRLISQHSSLLQASAGSGNACSKKRIAVCFSGGPAPGGHAVVAALADYCHQRHDLFGIQGGPGGLLSGNLRLLTLSECMPFFKCGGFHLLGTDRTKIKTPEQFSTVQSVVSSQKLDALIIIGGDDSHTNAAFLAEALLPVGCQVIGVPKTIDGDLRVPPYLPVSFGFDSAVSLYSDLVHNLILDTQSTHKYWHFVKLMGRHTGHITQAVGKNSQADLCLFGELAQANAWQLPDVISVISESILKDASAGKPYGVCCISEGLFEWLSDTQALFSALHQSGNINSLAPELDALLKTFPDDVQKQLGLGTDSHGNMPLSQIETERCLLDMVRRDLLTKEPSFNFQGLPHFFGYEGRCCSPSDFDLNFCAHLGIIAGALVEAGRTGVMAACSGFTATDFLGGIPLTSLLSVETRDNTHVPVIQKAFVSL